MQVLKRKHFFIVLAVALGVITLSAVALWQGAPAAIALRTPALVLHSPAVVSVKDREKIVVDVTLTQLPEQLYPAASISFFFDHNKLEFLGVLQGTMMTLTERPGEYSIPIWNCNPTVANASGQLNAMYLDITGGMRAYALEGFAPKEKDVVLRLAFRLRDSVQAGERYHITVGDAVFATADHQQNQSNLSTQGGNLQSFPAQIVVGE